PVFFTPCFLSSYAAPPLFHSFPTRRSSDLLLLRGAPPLEGARRGAARQRAGRVLPDGRHRDPRQGRQPDRGGRGPGSDRGPRDRSEEHTSELQSRVDLVCRLLLEKKNEQQY